MIASPIMATPDEVLAMVKRKKELATNGWNISDRIEHITMLINSKLSTGSFFLTEDKQGKYVNLESISRVDCEHDDLNALEEHILSSGWGSVRLVHWQGNLHVSLCRTAALGLHNHCFRGTEFRKENSKKRN